MISEADRIENKLKDALTTTAGIYACCHIERNTIIGMLNAMLDIAELELSKLTTQTQEKQYASTKNQDSSTPDNASAKDIVGTKDDSISTDNPVV